MTENAHQTSLQLQEKAPSNSATHTDNEKRFPPPNGQLGEQSDQSARSSPDGGSQAQTLDKLPPPKPERGEPPSVVVNRPRQKPSILHSLRHPAADLKHAVKSRKKKLKEKAKAKPPGGFDRTPLPSAPPGYTLKFTFYRATNLPAGDLVAASSDPFIYATLRSALPKRHEEDPDVARRTHTIRKTTDPEWNDEWIVASVPATGFTLECRIYDEDYPNKDDSLGSVTIGVDQITPDWEGIPPPGREFKVMKRTGHKGVYLVRATNSCFDPKVEMTPTLWVSIELLGQSSPPYGQMYTVGPCYHFQHFSPTIGRLAGTKVNEDEEHSHSPGRRGSSPDHNNRKTQRYDFQSNEIQFAGPVPPTMYHRFVEFRPLVGHMFWSRGIRGRILNRALHDQHRRIYNFSRSTQYGTFAACSEEASRLFLRLVHYDEGGRIFTYVLTLDGMFRFTETGREFSIDLLSKHTMHSDVATYVASAGEFFVRRLEGPAEGWRPEEDPAYYQLVIDNDSGTYRPDKSILGALRDFMARNLAGLGVVAMHCGDEELVRLKERQARIKKEEGRGVRMVLNRSPSGSSTSLSSAESDLNRVEAAVAAAGAAVSGSGSGSAAASGSKTKREQVLDLVENPKRAKGLLKMGKRADKETGGPSGS
ncbi:hypothetical protein SODALDRAFT_334244 [Sodiomyces alkalinus F11]|uniref:C2 domain-containing protein n=1 Tax=Sodiomyces alkalinus (strain CBS 110278 / VKM F-3762 / F11) TaxID=1314773 RepID=A0A3N2PRM4_SODAK|nr:hypothetical protein SODALDRAFT_334244 [Sodiomyces alkalinus F11]ROT37169.1 hypothetical protein SODALDRAFT_334244 [Sodiomyces alkalinus F11]